MAMQHVAKETFVWSAVCVAPTSSNVPVSYSLLSVGAKLLSDVESGVAGT